jgi:hypothetical protein
LTSASFDELGPDSYGSCTPPRVIVRQDAEKWLLLLLQEKEAILIDHRHLKIFDSFPETVAQYWMESGGLTSGPVYLGVEYPILTTVSPKTSRYKKFTTCYKTKHTAIIFSAAWRSHPRKNFFDYIANKIKKDDNDHKIKQF